MAFAQFSLFPDFPISVLPTPKRQAPKTTIIELQCDTQRAAELLRVHPSTLSKAKTRGKLTYIKGYWQATYVGKKGKRDLQWMVTFHR